MKTSIPPEKWEGRFSENQYDLLVKCVLDGDMKEWNGYRKKNRKEPILLGGAELTGMDLSRADLRRSDLSDANLSACHLAKTQFMATNLERAKLDSAHLLSTDFISAKMAGCRLTSVKAEGAKFRFADLRGAIFHEAFVAGCNFDRVNLVEAVFKGTRISKSSFAHSDFRGTQLSDARLYASCFNACIVDGDTLIWNCRIDSETDFTGVGLESARIEPELKSRIEGNIRQLWWKNWHEQIHKENRLHWKEFVKHPYRLHYPFKNLWRSFISICVRVFWWCTDYGSSTVRLISVFGGVMLFFAILYVLFPWLTNDSVLTSDSEMTLRVVRALYFSIVTITTVGFGDLAVNPQNIAGHLVMICHVVVGYFLLAALVVRLGILFTSMPASRIQDDEDEDENEEPVYKAFEEE